MLNVQRTLAIELQKLSVQFRKQQKTYLTRLRKAEGGGPSGLSVLDGTGERPADEEYDPGFSEIQARPWTMDLTFSHSKRPSSLSC